MNDPNNALLFDVFRTSALAADAPMEFYVRVPARFLADVLDMHDEGVRRVLRELVAEGQPESTVHHNGRGRFHDTIHTVIWRGRRA